MLAMPEYAPNDLRVLAFQSATGSGKTLLMHAHILQYRYYLGRAGGRLNNVVLLTPNEQMSAQHERELHASGLHARLFSSEAGADLFQPVEIIDLNKLAEKKGVQARCGGGLRRRQPRAGRRGTPGRVREGLARAPQGAVERRLHVRVLRDLQPGGGRQGSGSAARLRQVPAVRLRLPAVPRGRLRQGLRDLQPAARCGGREQRHVPARLPADVLPAVPHLAGQGGGMEGVQPGEAAVGVPRQDGVGVQQGGSGDPLRRRSHPDLSRVGARPRRDRAADDRAAAGGPVGTAGRDRRRLLRGPLQPSAASRSRPICRSVRPSVSRGGASTRGLPDGGRRRVAPARSGQRRRSGSSTSEIRRRSTSC